MTVALLTLVSLIAAQPVAEEEVEPVPIVDGVPSETELLAKIAPGPAQSRSFRATWQERASRHRPARIAWRLSVKANTEIIVERFDLGAAQRVRERYARDPAGEERPLAEAPAWSRWLMGDERATLVRGLALDGARRALDVVDGRILWVLGSEAGDGARPQVRIDRASGHLQRIVERRPNDSSQSLLDVALTRGDVNGPAPWLPSRLRVRVGDRYADLQLVSSAIEPPTTSGAP